MLDNISDVDIIAFLDINRRKSIDRSFFFSSARDAFA